MASDIARKAAEKHYGPFYATGFPTNKEFRRQKENHDRFVSGLTEIIDRAISEAVLKAISTLAEEQTKNATLRAEVERLRAELADYREFEDEADRQTHLEIMAEAEAAELAAAKGATE